MTKYRQAITQGATVRVYLHEDGRPSHWSIHARDGWTLVAAPGETIDIHHPGLPDLPGREVDMVECMALLSACETFKDRGLTDVADFCREGFETRGALDCEDRP